MALGQKEALTCVYGEEKDGNMVSLDEDLKRLIVTPNIVLGKKIGVDRP